MGTASRWRWRSGSRSRPLPGPAQLRRVSLIAAGPKPVFPVATAVQWCPLHRQHPGPRGSGEGAALGPRSCGCRDDSLLHPGGADRDIGAPTLRAQTRACDTRGLPRPSRRAPVGSGKASGLDSNTLVARHQTLTVPLCAVMRLESHAIPRPTTDRRPERIPRQGPRGSGPSPVPGDATSPTHRHPARTHVHRPRDPRAPRMVTCAAFTLHRVAPVG